MPGTDELQKAVAAFATERDWGQFHDPKNLAMALASEVGELCAVLRWVGNNESDELSRQEPQREALLKEIGDVAVLLLLLCDRVGARFDEVVLGKLASNALTYPIILSKGKAERPPG